jgi:hypothetical protein
VLFGFADETGQSLGVGHIGWSCEHAPRAGTVHRGGGLPQSIFATGAHRDVRTFGCQRFGHGPAEASRRRGDQSHPIGQSQIHDDSFLMAARPIPAG